MIQRIKSFKNITYNAFLKIKGKTNNAYKSLLRTNQLNKDTFTLSPPEKLAYNPGIIIGNTKFDLNDDRFFNFYTEYVAYNFEGYGNKFPNNYICIDSSGDRRLKPHILLKYVEIKPNFARQGAYSAAIKKLFEESKKEGCEGRIILNARKIESPGMTKIPSPALAHWKCGFRFAEEDLNKIMKRVLNGELPPENAPEGYMYYSLA